MRLLNAFDLGVVLALLMEAALFSNFAFASQFDGAVEVDETWGSRIHADLKSDQSDFHLKKTKKLGLQTTFAGATGLFGLNLDINFAEDFAISLGYGFSRGFDAINVHFKRALGGTGFIPYFVAGYSRWFSKGEPGEIQNTAPSILSGKFLSRRERETGIFSENIIYPGLGIQYINADGEWQGLGFFAEVLLLLDIDDFQAGPTAGIGSIYYF